MMAEGASYAILGRGRWAGIVQGVLVRERRRATLITEPRRRSAESGAGYRSRLSAAMAATGAQIAWICVPPGPHISLTIEAAILAGLHAVVEKPWLCSRSETDSLLALAESRCRLVAIHYQYCFLEEVERWRRDFSGGPGLQFGGHFNLNRPDRLGIPAIDNLGSHLLAIRAYAVPQAEVSEIRCGYDLPEERRVWVEREDKRVDSIDFMGTKEPLIQRFMAGIEAAVGGAEFPLDLRFALRVANDIEALKRHGPRGD